MLSIWLYDTMWYRLESVKVIYRAGSFFSGQMTSALNRVKKLLQSEYTAVHLVIKRKQKKTIISIVL